MERAKSEASMGWLRLERMTIDPEVMGGQPGIRGLRIPVSFIVKLLATGRTKEEILEDYPELEEEDIAESLKYAAWATSEKILEQHEVPH